MCAGQLYIARGERIECLGEQAAKRTSHYNTLGVVPSKTRMAVPREVFVFAEEGATVCLPVHVDYGVRTRIGAGTFLNYNRAPLDVADITIGEYCQLASGV